MKPDLDNMTTRQIFGYVAQRPRLYRGFACVLAQYAVAKAGFYWSCWSRGYTVREARRMAQKGHVTTT